MTVLCPECNEVIDQKVYKKTGRCSNCGAYFNIEDAIDDSEKKNKKKLAKENQSARSKYRKVSKTEVIDKKPINEKEGKNSAPKDNKNKQNDKNKLSQRSQRGQKREKQEFLLR